MSALKPRTEDRCAGVWGCQANGENLIGEANKVAMLSAVWQRISWALFPQSRSTIIRPVAETVTGDELH